VTGIATLLRILAGQGKEGQVRMSLRSALFGLVLMPRRGYGDSARGFNPGNRPINGSALKGRKLTWINPTRIAPQNEFRVCLASDWDIYNYIIFICYFRAPLGRVALGGRFPGLKPG
jgi:hypothetical protein